MLGYQHHGDSHENFICDRVKESTKPGTLVPATCQKTIEPVSHRRDAENERGGKRRPGDRQPDPLVKFSDVTVDLAARVIHRGEEEVHLTPIEFRLLAVLLNNAGKVLTQRQLLNQVWGPNAVEHSHYLRIYMGHLRQKLEQDPARPRHFITETGIGYRFMP